MAMTREELKEIIEERIDAALERLVSGLSRSLTGHAAASGQTSAAAGAVSPDFPRRPLTPSTGEVNDDETV